METPTRLSQSQYYISRLDNGDSPDIKIEHAALRYLPTYYYLKAPKAYRNYILPTIAK